MARMTKLDITTMKTVVEHSAIYEPGVFMHMDARAERVPMVFVRRINDLVTLGLISDVEFGFIQPGVTRIVFTQKGLKYIEEKGLVHKGLVPGTVTEMATAYRYQYQARLEGTKAAVLEVLAAGPMNTDLLTAAVTEKLGDAFDIQYATDVVLYSQEKRLVRSVVKGMYVYGLAA